MGRMSLKSRQDGACKYSQRHPPTNMQRSYGLRSRHLDSTPLFHQKAKGWSLTWLGITKQRESNMEHNAVFLHAMSEEGVETLRDATAFDRYEHNHHTLPTVHRWSRKVYEATGQRRE